MFKNPTFKNPMFKGSVFKGMFRKPADEPLPGPGPSGVPVAEGGVAAASGCAPGSEIRYHADLVERLHGQHVVLQDLCGVVREHAVNDRFTDAHAALESFRRALMAHLMEENVKLYTYLSICLAQDPERREALQSMKGEMGRIGIRVLSFFQAYAGSGITRDNKHQFLAELGDIVAALAGRIEQEETSLFGMYAPPAACARKTA